MKKIAYRQRTFLVPHVKRNVPNVDVGHVAEGAVRDERLSNQLLEKVHQLGTILQISDPWGEVVASAQSLLGT
jgi:hypothetical protein